jgi:hypothetical protein
MAKRNLYPESGEIPPDVPDDELTPKERAIRKLAQMHESGEMRVLGGVSFGPKDAITPEKLGLGWHGAHWGAWMDLYPEWRAVLETLLASGEDFVAHWGAKKEIQWVTFDRRGNEIKITGEVQIDNPIEPSTVTGKSPWHDGAWVAFGNHVPEEVQTAIADAMDEDGGYDAGLIEYGIGFSTIYKASKTFKVGPRTKLDTLLGRAEKLVHTAGAEAEKAYNGAENVVVSNVLHFVREQPKVWGFKSKKHIDQIVRKRRKELKR